MTTATVLDVCCGARMFWFDRQDPRAIFLDCRQEVHVVRDRSSKGGHRRITIRPDVVADFTALPFPDERFHAVIFDPPHLTRNGATGWMGKKYGTLSAGWRAMLAGGFRECFRVLRPFGTLIMKWNEGDIVVGEVLALTPVRPLVGNQCGKTARTHWLVFQKEGTR